MPARLIHRDQYIGLLGLTADVLLFTIANVLIKDAHAGLNLILIIFYRFSFCSLFLLVLRGYDIPRTLALAYFNPKDLFLHFNRSVTIIISTVSWFYAVSLLPLSVATCLFFLKSAFIVIFGCLDGFSMKARTWIMLCIASTGVVTITRPFSGSLSLTGLACILTFSAAAALNVMQMRRISLITSPYVTAFWLSHFGIIISFPFAVPFFQETNIMYIGISAALAGVFLLGQYIIHFAYRRLTPSVISIFDFSRMLIAIPVGFLVYGETIDHVTLIGVALILLAISIETIHGSKSHRDHDNTA
ncbi:DMT family transporter [Sinorhizobium meliloti]|uniref:DMT family transporter n=1 Tax=Rhizobium meliloti TaxID=382 RepID=UPI000FD36636|nr:DMT family transporter [Sinorhizobium meliloti]RVJ70731.1 DMT family transporter [Sinorhizobium meliloti]